MSTDPNVASSSQGALLVVEDEELVRSYVTMVLESGGHEVLQAKDGLMAVSMFEAALDRVAVVILDLTLPRLKGLEVAARIRALRPMMPIILMSGSHDPALPAEMTQTAPTTFLAKPFRPDALLAKVRQMLAP